MAQQTPLVLISGAFSTLFPGDTVGPATDSVAQASGNAGLVSASNKVPISGGYMTGQLFAASGVVVSGTLSRNGFNVVTVGDVETVTSTMIASGTIIDADVNISGAINATKLSFLQAGTSAVARTVDSKLKDIVSITDFGAVGDGTTNDQAAIQAALNTGKNVFVPNGTFLYNSSISFTASGQTFYGSGNKSILKAGSGSVYIQSNSCNNISLNDLRIECGATNGGFIINGSQNVTVSRIYWYEGIQVVWLFTCNTIKVVDCTFEGLTYGIIQQAGYASSFVLIDSNIALDMTGDFVEANCESGTPSSSWTITSNVFKGSRGWPTTGTEKRFVGITSVNGVVIDGNVVEKVAGDAAIHLENTLGETVISNNVFDNCMGSGGNDGYIYFLNSAENTIVTGNIFLRTDTTIAAATAIQSANNYSHTLQFVGNRVVAPAGSTNFSGLFTAFYYGPAVIADNIFENLQYAINTNTVTNFQITGNTFDGCVVGITRGGSGSGAGGTDFLVADNVFYGTTGTYDIFTSENTSGTQAGKRWLIQSNKFVKQLFIGAHIGAAPGDSGDAEDFQVLNNVFSSTASLGTSGTLSRFKNSGNVFQGTGIYDLNASNVTVTSGTAALPSLAILSDPNTGIFSPGADQLAVATNGTGRLFIDASGNVGVSTTSPATTLHLASSVCNIRLEDTDTNAYANVGVSNNGTLYLQADGANAQASSAIIAEVDGSEKVRLDSSGRLLIGTSSAGAGTVNAASIVGSTLNQSTGLITLSSGGTLDLDLLGTGIVGHLYVTSTYTAGAGSRTSTIFFIATRQGNNTAITSLNSANGSTNSRSFTITNPSANIFRFTDTSSSDCTVSMSFVGGIGF